MMKQLPSLLLVTVLGVSAALSSASCRANEVAEGRYCGTDTTYPPPSEKTIPSDLVLETTEGPLRPADLFEKCGSEKELLVLRVTAPWCGTCEWHEREWSKGIDPALRQKTTLIDVLVGTSDNATPTLETARAAASTAGDTDRIAIDPQWRVSRLFAEGIQLPAYVVVDPRTMEVVSVKGNPSPAALGTMLATASATIHGDPAPAPQVDTLFDGTFNRQEWEMIRAMTIPSRGLPDTSNGVADNPVAAAVGRMFFFETSWSQNGQISCQTCHLPNAGFADSLSLSLGIGTTNRNAMTVLMAGQYRWFFADGRADSAWMQALGPFEDANEFGSNRLRIAHVVAGKYSAQYGRAFGEQLPDISDATRFPAEGKPGTPSWDAMAAGDQHTVNRIFANVGKAIAAYERTIIVSANPFDRYAAGETQVLTADQKAGLKEFFDFGCAQCHFGSTLADDAFHNIRFPSGRPDGQPDMGRSTAFAQLQASEFSRAGPYSDAPEQAYTVPSDTTRYEGAFKTPTLRAIASTGPYGHAGNIATLEALVELYRTRGIPPEDTRSVGAVEPWVPPFAPTEGTHIAAFLKSFVGGAQWW